MAPPLLKRLTALQNGRMAEIEHMTAQLREKQPETLNKIMINSRIEALKTIWDEARQTHAEIIVRDDAENDSYIVNSTFNIIRDAYQDLLDELLKILSQILDTVTPYSPRPRDENDRYTTRCDLAKLPKLDLPKFSGNYEDWEGFSDLFKTLVHSRDVGAATKLSYLKLCLTGTAADLVKDVATTDANYATTWSALELRFHNPRLIVSNHLNALINMKPIKRESAVELRSFTDEAQRIVRALSNLKMPVEHWHVWLVHILSAKLDPESRKLWESELSERDRLALGDGVSLTADARVELNSARGFPKFADFANFLEKRSQTLNMIAPETPTVKRLSAQSSKRVFHARGGPKTSLKCVLCSSVHAIWKCNKLKGKTVYERRVEIRRCRLCFNCLGQHRVDTCPSKSRCNICREKHHTLLHFDPKRSQDFNKTSVSNDKNNESNSSVDNSSITVHTASVSRTKHSVLLATAQVLIQGVNGVATRVRALLDQGSEATFISESAAQLLGLPKQPTNISLSGLGASNSGIARYRTSFTLQSIVHPDFQLKAEALILPRLTSRLPACNLIEIDLAQYAKLGLADPQFHIRNRVDVILGADVYGRLLRSGLRHPSGPGLVAQNTALGWIVSGSVQLSVSRRAEYSPQSPVQALHCIPNNELNESLQRFWKIEELSDSAPKLKPDEEACERLYRESCRRGPDGRYTVRLPLKPDPPLVALETRRIAVGSLSAVRRRHSREPETVKAYRDFMETYEKLGHMTRIPRDEIMNPRAWYLPHHAVLQYAQGTLKKIRVVFDASRQTRDKYSLNKFLMAGPALQEDLALILLNWRTYRNVFTADIVKMFRQIRVSSEDQEYQRILWSPNTNETPSEYRLTTVTYGTACAPYLAIRTLHQLAQDEGFRFPRGAFCLQNNTYVDDTFSGADELSEAIASRSELTELLKSAGFELDKWAANRAELLPENLKQLAAEKEIDKDSLVKTLGIQWNPKRDNFTFSSSVLPPLTERVTKRTILSNITRLFDPLGWLSPVTVTAKVLMQDLWLLKCDWDTPLLSDVRDRWVDCCKSLASLSDLSVDRWLGGSSEQSYEIHGFSDASSRAYAAAAYLRIDHGNRNVSVSLLAAKTRVAPIKTISIPNLELCGAVLLVKLIRRLQKSDFLQGLPIYAWSDSQVILTWLQKHPRFWKTFVANRVSYIQTELPSAKWAHVSSKENSADLATRGSKPSELANSELWWHGPAWLALPPANWPQAYENTRTLHARTNTDEPDILAKFSSLTRLTRVVAYCLRPLHRMRGRKEGLIARPTFLTSHELAAARTAIIRLSQGASFSTEIDLLKTGKSLPKRHTLRKLYPVVDNHGILRVGGRLTHSNLPHDSKNPPILAYSSILSRLFANEAHHACLHGGLTLTASTVTQRVWILGRQRLVKSVIHKCVTCQRAKPRLAHQLMGDLPAARVTPARPFSTAGLDYAGPVQVRTTKGRGHKAYKGYIVMFVCFATRAVHLELVSDCTSATFIAAYRRFIGRRGICHKLFSDNATTFHGADRELREMFSAASEFYHSVAALLANDGTDWHFIPPNYGGLWEAGVKSTKHHLKRVIGEHTLTFEELSTLLVEIEACLNSRPLCPMSGEVDDLHALTPAHFLIGDSAGIIPDKEVSEL